MGRKAEYPKTIRVGNAVVKLYRLKHAHAKGGFVYQLHYRDTAGATKKPQFADESEAIAEARLQASKIAAGNVESADFSRADRDELLSARRLASGLPLLSAVQEWARARELTKGHVIAAAEAWAARNATPFTPVDAGTCVDEFVAAMDASGSRGTRTYGSKLKPLKEAFPGRDLHTIETPEWTAYLNRWTDGVTRNDIRKRTITLCRWARRNGRLPREAELSIEGTLRAKEKDPEIGILSPDIWARALQLIRSEHPHYLAALVLAGFAGERVEEIHGKRDSRDVRQTWEDIFLDEPEPFLQVTAAKRNTPSWRHTPLCRCAVAWLRLCRGKGHVCAPNALERVRDILRTAEFVLPENCFRHSYITYQVALTGNKPQIAEWAGTSVEKINRHYRRPVPRALAVQWFAVEPAPVESE